MSTTPGQQLVLAACLACLSATASGAALVNGGFESGFSGWTRVDQAGSDGTFALQSGTTSPVNGFAVPAPSQGLTAAMSDAVGPGCHVLYQDFVVPTGSGPFRLDFALFVRNAAGAGDFFVPGAVTALDFAAPALNQQARVDVVTTAADPFSIAPADVLQNLFQTLPGDPLTSGYTLHSIDVTSLFTAHAGETLRLRFAEVDNVSPLELGVDGVALGSALSATKTVAGSFYAGGAVTYTVTLHNGGLAQADNPGDELSDVLPAELILVSAEATSGVATATPATNTVTWNRALAAGGTVTITIHATVGAAVPVGTTVSNQGTASFDTDGDGTNDGSAGTDDPAVAGAADPTLFVVVARSVIEVPALGLTGLALLAFALAVAGVGGLKYRARALAGGVSRPPARRP